MEDVKVGSWNDVGMFFGTGLREEADFLWSREDLLIAQIVTLYRHISGVADVGPTPLDI